MKTLVTSKSEQVEIKIDLLYPSPLNSYDVKDVSDLVNSIRTCGLLTPLTVIGPNEDGQYEILAGERRYRSIMQINSEIPGFMDKVPCYLIGTSDMGQIQKQLAIELSNIETRDDYNRDAHRFQVIKLYKQLADNGDINEREMVSQIGEAMKLSKRYSGMYMAIFRHAIPELQQAVVSTKTQKDDNDDPVHIPVSVASRVSKLTDEQQREIVSRVNQGEKAGNALNDVLGRSNKSAKSSTETTASLDGLKCAGDLDADLIDDDDIPDWDNIDNHLPSDEDTGIDIPDEDFENDGLYDEESHYTRIRNSGLDYGIVDEDMTEELNSSNDTGDDGSFVSRGQTMTSKDNDVRKAIENHEDIDIKNFDVLGFMQRNHKPVDLSLDTTDEFSKINHSGKEDNTDKEVRRIVTKWMHNVSRKLDRSDALDEDDACILDELAVLLEKYNSIA